MRTSLARIATAVTAMVALSFVVPLGLLNGRTAHDRAMTAAERQAASLVPVLSVTRDPAALNDAVGSVPAGTAGRLALHLPTGEVLGSPHAPAGDLAAARRHGRTATVEAAGGKVLLRPVLLEAGTHAVIEVHVPQEELSRGVARSWLILALVALALVLVSVAMADRLATRVVRAAERLVRAVTRVAAGDLAARVDPQGPPELRAAGEAFNHMADRLARLLAGRAGGGRRPVAPAAHPADGPAGRPGRAGGQPRRPGPAGAEPQRAGPAGAAVDEIIAAARRPAGTVAGAGAAAGAAGCDAAEVVRRRMAFWSALAEDQDRGWDLVGADAPAPVPVPEAELAAAVDALMGNVFRHTPHGTAFRLTVHRGRHSTGLLFGDAGPGIPDGDAALRRGASGAGSTGLGLDIARRLAESTGGSLRIGASPLGGAQIEVWLRTAPKPASRRSARRAERRAARR